MTRKQKRLSVILAGLAFLGAATGLTFYALGQKASYFYMPADLATATVQPGQRIRLGGLVEKGTIVRGSDGTPHLMYSGEGVAPEAPGVGNRPGYQIKPAGSP